MDERAVVLWLPGGGWHTVSPETGAALARHGLRIVPGRYRLVPEVTWPDQLADVRAAARAARAEAGGLPLLVAGDSAGGHLALQLGLRGIDRVDDVAGVLAFWPPVDPLAPDWAPARAERDNPWRGLLGHVPAAGDPATVDVRPVSHVGNRVPVLLAHGVDDPAVPATQSAALTCALLAAGHPVHTLITHGGHGLDLTRPDVAA